MRYVTTRSDRESYTPHQAMTADRAPDGGWFLPEEAPVFTEELLRAGAGKSFNENVAAVLRLLFDGSLTGRDIDLVAGKAAVNLLPLNSHTHVVETWRNLDCDFAGYRDRLFNLMVRDPFTNPGQWFTLAVEIAVIYAVFAELAAAGKVSAEAPLDLAVPSFDFRLPMAARYARSWGLPIGTIICACNENNAPWCLLHQGELRTDVPVRSTGIPACDQAVPAGLERLIHSTLGMEEAGRWGACVAAGRLFTLEAAQQAALREGISVSVVSRRRMDFMLPNLFGAGGWHPDPYAAMAYTGLVDHRAAPGDTGMALVIAGENPVYSAGLLSGYLGIPAEQIRRIIENG